MGKKAATGIGKGSVRKRAEEEAESNGAINQIFLDNLPPVAMLLRPHT